MAALHGAVALGQPHGVLEVVGQHLDLDVARVLQELLHVNHGVTEGVLGLGPGHVDRIDQRRLGMDHAHAAAAAAPGGLDDHRVADGAGDLHDLLGIFGQRAFGAGDAGHTGDLHRVLGRDLVAHEANGFRLGPDEDEAGLLDPFGEIGVLREEAVAGVDSVTSAAEMMAGTLR